MAREFFHARLLLTAAVLVLLGGTAQAQRERTIICDGAYRGERIGYCHLMDHITGATGTDVPEPVGLEKITKAGCEMYERCVIKAKVNDTGSVLKIYWAKKRK